jgi:ABC-type sugar transport system ATPase subunit
MISIKNLVKIFKSSGDSVRAVDGVTLDIGEREFFVLLGLSGSGKTTLLRCVAGLEKPDSGEIAISNTLVSSSERNFFRRARRPRSRHGVSVLRRLAAYDGVSERGVSADQRPAPAIEQRT